LREVATEPLCFNGDDARILSKEIFRIDGDVILMIDFVLDMLDDAASMKADVANSMDAMNSIREAMQETGIFVKDEKDEGGDRRLRRMRLTPIG